MKKMMMLAAMLLVGCGSLQRQYVEQDAADFKTMSPRVLKMIDETQLYDEDQKQDMRDRLTARELRIQKALESLSDE